MNAQKREEVSVPQRKHNRAPHQSPDEAVVIREVFLNPHHKGATHLKFSTDEVVKACDTHGLTGQEHPRHDPLALVHDGCGQRESRRRVMISQMAWPVRHDFSEQRRRLFAVKVLTDGTIARGECDARQGPDDFGLASAARFRLIRRGTTGDQGCD